MEQTLIVPSCSFIKNRLACNSNLQKGHWLNKNQEPYTINNTGHAIIILLAFQIKRFQAVVALPVNEYLLF